MSTPQVRTSTVQKTGGFTPFKLPATASAKVRALTNMVEEAWLLANNAKDRTSKARDRVHQLDQLHVKSDADNAELAELKKELADLEEAQTKYLERYERTKSLLANIDTYVKHNLESMGEPVAEYIRPARVKLTEGVSPPQQVEAIRLKLIECKTGIQAIEHAPIPRKDQIAVVEKWVDRFLLNSKPRLNVVKGEVRLAFNGIGTEYLNSASHMQVIAIAAFFADVDRDTLVKRMVAMLPEPSAETIPVKDREHMIANMRDRMLQLERDEEAAIVRAAEDSIHILRRADASPQAVLGIVVGSKARAAA